MVQRGIRHYVVLKRNADLMKAYERGDRSGVLDHIVKCAYAGKVKTDVPFRVSALHSLHIGPGITRAGQVSSDSGEVDADDELTHVVVQLHTEDADAGEEFTTAAQANSAAIVASSPDLPFAGADHWCVADTSAAVFGDRKQAERLLNADHLRANKADGANVNVIIVDQGLDAASLGRRFGGGWPVKDKKPGTTVPLPGGSLTHGMLTGGHGMMIAQNILSIAPQATLFDLPLVPWAITDAQAYLSTADIAFRRMLRDIREWKNDKTHSGPWVMVNPWGIYDSSLDPHGHYTNNPDNPFNRLVAGAVADGIDVIFPAGNCGQFCPDGRCGSNNIGPGRDILGANSLAEVITVGAVRVDAMWLGYSSQGPGQPRLAHEKPDLCAPSHFQEPGDSYRVNTGTSAACALMTGIVAALRSRWDAGALSPAALKQILIDTAFQPSGGGWNDRTGHGIVDAKAAFDKAAAA